LNVASALVAEERRRGPGFHGVGLNGCDEFILQPMQVFSRFDYDPREADRRRGDVVILERTQRPCRGLLFGQDRVRCRKYLVEVDGLPGSMPMVASMPIITLSRGWTGSTLTMS
jgi:hypothetical protein